MRIVSNRGRQSKFQIVFEIAPEPYAGVTPRSPDWQGKPRQFGYTTGHPGLKLIPLAEAADRTGISADVLREDYGRYMHGIISRSFAERHGIPYKNRKHRLNYPLPARSARRQPAVAVG